MTSTTAQMRWRGQNFRTFLSVKIAGVAAVEIVACFTARTGKMPTELLINTRKTYVRCQTCQRSQITSSSTSREHGEASVEQAPPRQSGPLVRQIGRAHV